MQLGQILDILEKRYSSEVLRELPWDESYKRGRDREEIIRAIWKSVIVPQVAKIQQNITSPQKVGLYYYLDFRSPDDESRELKSKIGVSDSLIRQFDSIINSYLSNDLAKKAIEQVASGNLNITNDLHGYKDDYTKLSKQLQKPYEKSFGELISRLREAVVDPETLEKLKNIEGIAPCLTEDNKKGTPTTSLKITDLHVMRMEAKGPIIGCL